MATATMTARRGPRHWTEDEWSRVLEAVREVPTPKNDGRSKRINRPAFWLALILIARDTGLSRRKIASLRRSQLAPNGTIVVHFTNPDRDVVLRLKQDTLQAISKADTCGSNLLASPISHDATFAKAWRRILKAAGFSKDQRRELWYAETRVKESDCHTENIPPKREGQRPDTLLTFYVHHYKPLRLRGRSARTDALYRYSVKNFERFLGRVPTLDDLTDRSVGGLLEWMRTRGLAVETIDKERSQLLAMWRFAARLHFVNDYPTLERDVIPKRVPVAWMSEELRLLFEAASKSPGMVGKVPSAMFWTALLWVLYDTGERISALIALEWHHVDMERGHILIPAELRKGKREDKFFSLKPQTVDALRKIKRTGAARPFEWTKYRTYLWDKFGKVLESAGLPSDSRSKFHRIRRTVASMFEARGHNATALLGHSNRSTTEKYIDPRICKPVFAADVLPDPMTLGKDGAK